MARDVRRWVAFALVACGVIGIAFLPPRGGVRASGGFVFAIPQPTPMRLRAQGLAAEWRIVDGAARMLEQRERARSARSPRGGSGGPTVLLTGRGSIPPSATALVTAAMDSAWAQLGLGDTKIGVRVVVELAPSAGATTSIPPMQGEVYLEPDSTDRTACVALVPAGLYWTRVMLGEPIQDRWRAQFVRWLQASLGPCAFYAAYGAPSRTVRRWLAARKWDVGRTMAADGKGAAGYSSTDFLGDPRQSWYWESIYAFPPATIACMAGRPAGCRAAVLEGTGQGTTDSLPRIIVSVARRWWQTQNLVPGERYLSDVARTVGRERFLQFWSSPLPVDTALALALRRPVGEWTSEWQRGYVRPLRLGAAAPLGAYFLALVLGALAVMSVASTASRRQVR